MEKIHYASCPLCGSDKIFLCLTTKDHTVSQESFEIMECKSCSARFTQDVPPAGGIGRYYKSSDYISHTDTRKGIVNKAYHAVRNITLKRKRKLVQQTTSLKKGKLLDVGAGTGLFVQTMIEAGWDARGLEPDEDARKIAARNNIALEDLANLFLMHRGSFDVITLWHVIEHVHQIHRYLDRFKELLTAEGRLIIAVPNFTSHDAKHYGSFWAAYDVPRHLYHFAPDAMRTLLQKHGFAIANIYPQWFDSFYVSLLSEKYKTGKTNLVKGTWEGFRSNINTLSNKSECSSLIYVATRV